MASILNFPHSPHPRAPFSFSYKKHDRNLLKHLVINYSGKHQSLNYKFQHLLRSLLLNFIFVARIHGEIFITVLLPLAPINGRAHSTPTPAALSSIKCIAPRVYLLYSPPHHRTHTKVAILRMKMKKKTVRKLVFWQMAHVQNFSDTEPGISSARQQRQKRHKKNLMAHIKSRIKIHRLKHVRRKHGQLLQMIMCTHLTYTLHQKQLIYL